MTLNEMFAVGRLPNVVPAAIGADLIAALEAGNAQLRTQEVGWQQSASDCHTRALKAEAENIQLRAERAAWKHLYEVMAKFGDPAPPPAYVPDPIPAVMEDKPKEPKPHDPFNLPLKDRRRMGPE
jgi:hypothetical protein